MILEQIGVIERIESAEKRSPSLRANEYTLQIPDMQAKTRITMAQDNSSGSLGASEMYVLGVNPF